jgi:hypothetical protein
MLALGVRGRSLENKEKELIAQCEKSYEESEAIAKLILGN